ncbi:SWI/SNF complex component snf12 [Orbilia javanica]|uniref:SWI/SNF complex component snf12 n=1 Tax=Orbilia javanica TaxID=47235 RepID=A0AAN8RF20_9PEZI
MNTMATPINYPGRMGPQYPPHQQLQTPTRVPAQGSIHVQQNRRGPGPMVTHQQSGHQPMSQAQMQQQVAQARALELEQAKRRARKPTDKTISSAIEEIAPLTTSYNDIRSMERRLDAAIMRKRLDVQDSVAKSTKNHRVFRLFISNTAFNQPWQGTTSLDETSFDFSTDLVPSFRMKIEGRLLDLEDGPSPTENAPEKPEAEGSKAPADAGKDAKKEESKNPKKLSQIFKSIRVEVLRSDMDPSFGENSVAEWQRPPPPPPAKPGAAAPAPPAEFDGFEFERKMEVSAPCAIQLIRDEQPERFQLSPELQSILDTSEDSRAGIMLGIWEYAYLNGLQDRDERRNITCDEKLKKAFKLDRFQVPQIPDLISPHLKPLEPIAIKYMIKVDTASTTPVVHDILITEDEPLRLRMLKVINSQMTSPLHRNLSMEDDNIAVLVQAINHSKAKRDFWTSLGMDPAAFIQQWVSSQKRDLEVILGEKGVDSEESRRAAFYQRDAVAQNAYLLLHGRDQAGMR